MDVKAYKDSGVIQDYCLGLLGKEEMQQVEQYAAQYPELQEEINSYQQALEGYAMDFAQAAPVNLKAKTLDLLDNLSKENHGQVDNLPLLNQFSARENWLRIVEPLLPATLEEDSFIKVLRDDEKVFQTIFWSKVDYPDEVHGDEKESFLILLGECECCVGGELIRLGPGGYLDVPMHVHHDVRVVSGPVLAIVQRLKIA
jgi:mannose-6-phosphate isomerase-like protein (cupin superfamily)